ncbi:MAG TPA: anti-sigma factor antagonist [Herpetosiphon sp.]|uniref:Anti-sigma-factor antagonist n=1 Tax=Herpetosiphon aurantiacus (strain ATCC 23779 / DSM 785 / 114-95) TaxID=316274 RepID=A9AX21_HERA2|nr:STAS domain-containing protein [Herpetosiphon sp.]ABX04829.1 anti-sigma-factor antagonist [Herpetosiphon aurantiacus DSM 785]HBW52505.1 anti-sigma factor antagonist [Herpetosiphon sp.]
MSIASQTKVINIGILTLSDRFDIAALSTFRQAADHILAQTNYLVIDMAAVSFFDSAGMAALVNVLKRVREQAGDIRVVWPIAEAARRIVSLTKFDRVFTSSPSVESALSIW